MINYEVIFLIKGRINEQRAGTIFEGIVKSYSKASKILQADFKGKKQLAYPVRRNTHGYFCVINFGVDNFKTSIALEEILRTNDNVLKFITIRMED